jgi:2-polyprenyl-3-methyl-5-hydroxy-6-metoxy-1,4-benzoquinol methylase
MKKTPSYTKYWQVRDNFTNKNSPKQYGQVSKVRGEFILKCINDLNVNNNSTILEIGSNVGRNLEHLRNNGYQHLHCIEINKNAIEYGKKIYPELYKQLSVNIGRCYDILPTISTTFDVIFTMAVLMHIDDDERKVIYDFIAIHSTHAIFIEHTNDSCEIKGGRMFNKLDAVEEMQKRGFKLIKPIFDSPYSKNYSTIIMKK